MMLQTAMPLLAVDLHASYVLLGTIGWVAQAIRTPFCITSGHISERLGRTRIIVPAALVAAVMIALHSQAKSPAMVMVLYSIALASIGMFYPPLQALIGDVSQRGELRKNLGMFNVGWCVGGAITAAVAGPLVKHSLSVVFYVGAICCVVAAGLVLSWRAKPVPHDADEEDQTSLNQNYGPLLLICRMGHFVGFFGYSVIRILFVKLGRSTFLWTRPTVALVCAALLCGLGVGILLSNASPWWRGKLWPQVLAQSIMFLAAAGTALVSSPAMSFLRIPAMIGGLFFAFGAAQSITYTGALYYGLSDSKRKGANTGIHEAIVAGAAASGCLFGGIAAQKIDAYAPFVLLGGLALVCLIATCFVWARRPAQAVSP